MVQDRTCCIFYTTAVCNLKCVYCYIDKNPALVKIDEILDESFKGDYYFNFTKEMFPDPNQLKEVQFWGGEPTLRLDRAYYTVEKLIEYYPNLTNFMMSTNFTGANWFEQFYGFMNILNNFPNRHFNVTLQLSIDGPTNINDSQRGKGVTKLFTEHFLQLIDTVEENIPNNVSFMTHFKPTLTSALFPKLQTKEQLIDYYNFFEFYYKAFRSKIHSNHIAIRETIPNTACPSPHTKEDGILFANLCKSSFEIMEDIKNGKSPFTYYRNIMPFSNNFRKQRLSYKSCKGNCGSGFSTIGLLPYHMISACHNGFTDLISDYKKYCAESEDYHAIDFRLFLNDSHNMIHTLESFKKYEKMSYEFFNDNSTVVGTNMAGLVRLLAIANQIDRKYTDPKMALDGALFIKTHTSYCMRDNIGSTGSLVMTPVGMIKLLLNGAREYIENV